MATARIVEEKVYTKTEKVVLVMTVEEAKRPLKSCDRDSRSGVSQGPCGTALRAALEGK